MSCYDNSVVINERYANWGNINNFLTVKIFFLRYKNLLFTVRC